MGPPIWRFSGSLLLVREDVRLGHVDIGLIDRMNVTPPTGAGIAMLAAAVDRFLETGDSAHSGERHRIEAGVTFEVYRTSPKSFEVVNESQVAVVDYERDGEFQSWLIVDGHRYRIERAPGDTTYIVDGTPHRVAAASGGMLVAPSAALVLKVAVELGEFVEANQLVAIVESMKMEVRIVATTAGTVREIFVQDGAQVKSGQALVFVESSDEVAPRESAATVIPWTQASRYKSLASSRLHAAITGWDCRAEQTLIDAHDANPESFEGLLSAFADMAELFERRPDHETNVPGQVRALTAALTLNTTNFRGLSSVPSASKNRILAALAHYGLDDAASAQALEMPLRRIRRAGERLGIISKAAVIILERLEAAPDSFTRSFDTIRPPTVHRGSRSRRQSALHFI